MIPVDGAALATVDFAYRPSLQTQHLGLFVAMTLASFSAGYWVARTRRTRGARLFAVTLLLVGLRTGSDIVHLLVGEWTILTILVAINPVLELGILLTFVRFTDRYARMRRFTSERARRAVLGILGLAVLAVATDPFHGLVFQDLERLLVPFTHVGVRRGPIGSLLVVVNATLLFVGVGQLVYAFTTGPVTAQWPTGVLSLALSHAVLVEGLQFTRGGVIRFYEYGALAIGGFVLLTTVALLDHGLRPIESVARDAILDEIEDAVVLLDDEGNVVDYNLMAEHVFDDLEGKPFLDRFPELSDVTMETGTVRKEVTYEPAERGSGAVPAGDERVDGRQPETERSDAVERTYLVHVTRVTDEADSFLGFAYRFVDVTELKRRSQELREANERLDQFASTASHDLRNPLNVAMGYVDILSADVEADDDLDVETAVEYLETVDTSIERMNAIIDDILALLETADPVAETSRVDYEDVVVAAWETVDTRDATIHVTSGGSIEADPDRLQRLLENLFRNAVEHVGPDVAIETGLCDGGIYVSDDGPGIAVEDRDQVFEHGYTTGDDGTGLGLSIVSQLAEAHGWEVALDPTSDGARFEVSGCDTDPE